MDKTPRTDNASFCITDTAGKTHDVVGRYVVRELERENARLREALKWAEAHVPNRQDCDETRRMIHELLTNFR